MKRVDQRANVINAQYTYNEQEFEDRKQKLGKNKF